MDVLTNTSTPTKNLAVLDQSSVCISYDLTLRPPIICFKEILIQAQKGINTKGIFKELLWWEEAKGHPVFHYWGGVNW